MSLPGMEFPVVAKDNLRCLQGGARYCKDMRHAMSWLGNAVEGRSWDDEKSKMLRSVFEQRRDRLNSEIVMFEQAQYPEARAVRYMVAKPQNHGGAFQWGCWCCFNLITSVELVQLQHQRVGLNLKGCKMKMARLATETVPKLQRLKSHSQSGLHRAAVDFVW